MIPSPAPTTAPPPDVAAYARQGFAHTAVPLAQLPLPDEPHVAVWRAYLADSQPGSPFAVLRQQLPQLRFPVRTGISRTPAYRAATRQGAAPDALPEATGLQLHAPDQLQLRIHAGATGALPVLIAPHRADFVLLVQAFLWRNEPRPVPETMGACMITGFNNWGRIHAYRRRWQAQYPHGDWAEGFRQLLPYKTQYQDRFMLLGDGPYSAVPAAALGLPAAAWLALSRHIRLAHEYAHYVTQRLFGETRRHLFDELLADYAGIVAAAGDFRPAWLCHFWGLEDPAAYRPGGRLENYLPADLLQPAPLAALRELVLRAVAALQAFDHACAAQRRDAWGQMLALAAIASLDLQQLAAGDGARRLRDRFHALLAAAPDAASPAASGDETP